ncbi:beta-TrCP-like [Mizuhopecten yessoensis]|nr:beta-TrCP-like [Mizuhopecten yessoensis]
MPFKNKGCYFFNDFVSCEFNFIMSVTVNGSGNASNGYSNHDNAASDLGDDPVVCNSSSHEHKDRAKRRGCARHLSSVPSDKYLCQKDSKTSEICKSSSFHYATDQGICSMDSRNASSGSSESEWKEPHQHHRNACTCAADSGNVDGGDEMDGNISPDSADMVFHRNDQEPSDPGWEFRSTCPVTSWGHFSKTRKEQYKYRRSDYSSDSEDDSSSKTTLQPLSQSDGESIQRSHLPMCDLALSPLLNVSLKKKEAIPNGSSRISCRNKDGVKPTVFKEKIATILRWFNDCSDSQKNMVLKGMLRDCDLPQLHLLSVKMGPNLHRGCPPNCQDIITWLPADIASKIMSFLDPVSLCHAAQVCKVWRHVAEEASFWRKFCCQPKWRLSKAAEHQQVISHMSSEGSIMWKKVFAERFRLRNNWLSGRCTVRTFEGHSQGISCVQFDDTRIVSGSSDKTIKVWNIRTNAPWSVQTLVGHSGTVRCLHLEGKRLVSGSTDKSIKVWDLSTQESWSSIACKVTMVGHTDTVRCLQVDDDKVISGSYDTTLKVWDLRTGHCRMTLRGHLAAVLCVHFSDTKIVSGSCDKAIKVWNYFGDCVRTLTGHQDAVTCLQFDSTRIVSGSLDCNLKFWDIHSGECMNTIDWKAAEGHTGVVRCLQADSWRLVSAADDKTIKVWNLETGKRLVTLRNHTDGVTCLQFNDFIIVSGSYDKTVKLWDFSCC